MYLCLYVCMYVCMYVCIHTHTYIVNKYFHYRYLEVILYINISSNQTASVMINFSNCITIKRSYISSFHDTFYNLYP